jgi:hypothetical protein
MSDTLSGSVVQTVTDARRIVRAAVLTVHEDGTVSVDHEGGAHCDVLQTGAAQPRLAPGDSVLVWFPGRPDEAGVVLGRIGPTTAPLPPAPEHVVIEARKGLSLTCGRGTIAMREDGKVLIKGTDIVSHAERMNRVKGGGVAIN